METVDNSAITDNIFYPHNLFLDRFNEWSCGREKLDAAQNIYKSIRDIPYSVYVGPPQNPVDILVPGGEGSCTPKHIILGDMLGSLGFQVRYSSAVFNWSDLISGSASEIGELTKLEVLILDDNK